jgi:hypothetical protein
MIRLDGTIGVGHHLLTVNSNSSVYVLRVN